MNSPELEKIKMGALYSLNRFKKAPRAEALGRPSGNNKYSLKSFEFLILMQKKEKFHEKNLYIIHDRIGICNYGICDADMDVDRQILRG
jgi:hypothetical protein